MKKYFLIILTMAVAFAFSSYAGKNIFVAYTPRVNRNYLADLKNKFNKNVNNVYLAFSFFKQKPAKENIAAVYPTLIPITSKTPEKTNFAKVDPASIPANLFKSISKGVSAYDGEGGNVILKIEKGTTYKITKVRLPDGRTIDIYDYSSQ